MNEQLNSFWSIPADQALQRLNTTPDGLTNREASERLERYGANLLRPRRRTDPFTLFLSQFKSPIILILLFAAVLSFFLQDRATALIIMAIIIISGFLGFWQEKGAVDAVEKLLAIVEVKTTVLRDGKQVDIPIDEAVPGDITILNAGDSIPGDCLILESSDLFVDEATLTGETYPVEKEAGVVPTETPLARRSNALFMGTHVVSGSAKAVIVRTGKDTEFGKVSESLKLRAPETEFEHGVKVFGYFLLEVTLMLVVAIFAINVYLNRPVLESFLFSLALAVGLTPQLLPAIISINLAHGAKQMAEHKVIVKRLESIENFGSMNVLCSDKTGTLTEGLVRVHGTLGVDGSESEKVLLYAYLNAFYETSFMDPIDEAIRRYNKPNVSPNVSLDVSAYRKVDEVPYDFIRKRLSVLVEKDGTHLMVTKGALSNILGVCSKVELPNGRIVDTHEVGEQIKAHFEQFSTQGFRTLGVSYKDVGSTTNIDKNSETNMTFIGFILLFDPPKQDIIKTIGQLKNLGVTLKIITGDNALVAASVSKQVGIENPHIMTGTELNRMSDDALLRRVNRTQVFAEVEPNQKRRILFALRRAGNVVGYIGDGINDGPALHAADVGISVDTAADVAKEAADIVLLEKDLGVLTQGVQEGRTTFANTLKYVFMATSANFGNMFSMAGASLFLPFLPLLPTQILLTNLLTDFPETTISTDRVDQELIDRPRRWNIDFIRKFMVTFGLLSSVFDYLTFGALLFILHAGPTEFRTGWFMESVVSASLIVLVIRTRKPFYASRPSKYLTAVTLLIVGLTILLPYTPLSELFAFIPVPPIFLLVLGGILILYIAGAELAKRVFYRHVKF